MKRLLKIAVFIALVWVADFLGGYWLKNQYNQSTDPTLLRLKKTLYGTNEQILVFGSSRSMHHIIPSMISDTMAYSAYNCGMEGQGMAFSFLQLSEALSRYTPRLAVVEISPNILMDKESGEKIKIVLPFCKTDSLIYSMIARQDFLERLKLMSHIYPYNSMLVNFLKKNSEKKADNALGYFPLYSVLDSSDISHQLKLSVQEQKIPQENFAYLDSIVLLSKNHHLPLVLVISPYFRTNTWLDVQIDQIMQHFPSDTLIPVLNFSKFRSVYENPMYFKDLAHLNHDGARLFTTDLIKELKKIIAVNSTPNIQKPNPSSN